MTPERRPAAARSARRRPAPAASDSWAGRNAATKAGKAATKARTASPGGKQRPRPPAPSPEEAARAWAEELRTGRPGLVAFALDALGSMYGRPIWVRRNEPTSELVLTILSQNSADVNAEKAFEALRAAYPSAANASRAGPAPRPGEASAQARTEAAAEAVRAVPDGWGGEGLPDLPPPDWTAVEAAPLAELVDVIRPGGLGPQKAPRIQAALAAIRAAAGGYSLEFLAAMPARAARDWLASIPGIGPKTASVVLLFSFGSPLMPVDRHVARVSGRVGLIPPKATPEQAHELYLALLEPDQMYEAHVGLITHGRRTCHARNPECGRCALAPRCRYVLPDAP